MKGKLNILLTGLILAALIVTACGAPPTPTAEPAAPPEPPPTAVPTDAPAPTEAPTAEPAPVEGDPYLIGSFFSTTGPTSSLGEPEANTVNMLVEQVNAAGGV
ncbi:MAG: hypothetical protein AAB217_02305, partial [Chloroflexota bacterium]